MMDDPVSRGLPFEVGDLWRPPHFAGTLDEHDSILDAWRANAEALTSTNTEEQPHFDFNLDIPDLEPLHGELEPLPDNVESSPKQPDTSHQEDAPELDFWDVTAINKKDEDLPNFHTWEAFEKKSAAASERHALLSEAGPHALDAALASIEKNIGVLPQDFVLRSLCALVLGRSSSLFQWKDADRCFQQTLEGASISGTSLASSQSLVADLVSFGNILVGLRQFAEDARSLRRSCAALLALRSCTASILEAVDQSISGGISKVRSMIQLQQLVRQPQQLLGMLCSLVEEVKGHSTDESVISALSDRIHADAQKQHQFCGIMQNLLARVCVPWLEILAAVLGFDNAPTTLTGHSFVDVGTEEAQPGSTSFINSADRELIREARTAVALLRDHSPEHVLLNGAGGPISSPLPYFTQHTSNPQNVVDAAKKYELTMISALRNQWPSNDLGQTNPDATAMPDTSADDLWRGESLQAEYLVSLSTAMSLAPDEQFASSSDALRTEAFSALTKDACDTSLANFDLSNDLGAPPIVRLRPFIRSQHRLVNGILIRQLLRERRLRHHLSMQKSFQLLGNGAFVARLSKTLFSPEVQSAERKRGVVPTAETMGLRLGSAKDQRWPPASSELQLTLMGILKEAAGLRKANDKLSFAIRELPEEEIERVLDPHSIYALDFLRLQYAVSAPLDAVLTPNTLTHYDSVFRFLLKLLRLDYITSTLPRSEPGSRAASGDHRVLSFAHEARLFVTVLMSHFMDMGIDAPWKAFMDTITKLENSLAEEDSAGEIGSRARLGVDGLRQEHEACLDRIRSRLFLKRKQEKLRTAIEAVFAHILKATTVLQVRDVLDMKEFQTHSGFFYKSAKALVDLLKEMADKPPKSLAATDAEDTEMMQLLLHRLNWNGHYEEHDQTW